MLFSMLLLPFRSEETHALIQYLNHISNSSLLYTNLFFEGT